MINYVAIFKGFNAPPGTSDFKNLIVIVKQSIDKMSRIDKRMQMTLKLWTYLEWPKSDEGKSGFWQKLAVCLHNSLNNHYQSIMYF